MRSTAGEIEFWRSLKEPITSEKIFKKYEIHCDKRKLLESVLVESRNAYEWYFIPENASDQLKSAEDSDPIWCRADWVSAYHLSSDLIRKVEALLTFLDERLQKAPRSFKLINESIVH